MRIANFRLVRFIAKGGMGQVWEAFDEELRRPVALKLVLPERIDARSLLLFTREARAGGRLAHPSIVTTLGHGTDGGRAWIAQELIEGSWTLKDFLDELRAADATPKGYYRKAPELMAKLADALQAAHTAGVIHRDVKPQNVLIAPDDTPKLTDFGLARVADDSFASVSGEVAGTYAYMSPEQVSARRTGIDHRSDIFSLGIVLYELLTFRRPFEGDTTHQIADRIIAFDPPEPTKIRSQCPRELSVICGKALEKEPERRYQTMEDFAADLRRHLRNEPIRAKPPGPIARAVKWSRRNPALSSSGAVAALALGIVSSLLAANVRTSRALASTVGDLERSNVELGEQTDLARSNARLAEQRAEETAEQARIALEHAESARLAQLEAEQRTADVLSLSAQKDLDDLVAEAERLWPPHPELAPRCERWLAAARVLRDGRPADEARGLDARPSLAEHRDELCRLRARAVAASGEELLAQARLHELWPALESKRAERLWHARMLELEPWPAESDAEAALERELATGDAQQWKERARTWVAPEAPAFGREFAALLLVARAVEALPEEDLPDAWWTFARASLRCGRLEEAEEAAQACLDVGGEPRAEAVAELRTEIERWRGPALEVRRAELALLDEEIAELELAVGLAVFDDPEDGWWHRQLSELVSGIEALFDPEHGLAGDTVAAPFGWGVARRLYFAASIAERSMEGEDAARRWSEAVAAIRASPAYGGLELAPQIGLLPLGPDPDSGLWEFAHLMTGEEPRRDEAGKLILSEEMSIVLVLIPGGRFWMGAQNAPGEQNHDPDAASDERPVHELELSPYFLSKYEMTQGQWARTAGRNPAFYGAERYSRDWNREGAPWSSLHPVEQVSWTDSLSTLEKLRLTLPSEAQWERGARGGTASVYWTGDDMTSLSGAANLADRYGIQHGHRSWQLWERELDDGSSVHARAGSYRANPFGLHEVHGNVWEWCLDGYQADAYLGVRGKDALVPGESSETRVSRGGAFGDMASNVRVAHRRNGSPDYRVYNIGLRPARGVEPPRTGLRAQEGDGRR